MPTQVGFIMLVAQYSETDFLYTFVFVICWNFQRLNWGHSSHWGAARIVEITWRPAGAVQTCFGLTLDRCKKIDKTIMADQSGATLNK
jgi:hypothetical protein